MNTESIPLIKIWELLGKSDNVILAGSTALAYHGLLDISQTADIDLRIIHPTPAQRENLSICQDDAPNPRFIEGGRVSFSFYYFGSKIDVWIIKRGTELDTPSFAFTPSGIPIAGLMSIIEQKRAIGRPKDWIQLMQLADKIFSMSAFSNILGTISTATGEGYESIEAVLEAPEDVKEALNHLLDTPIANLKAKIADKSPETADPEIKPDEFTDPIKVAKRKKKPAVIVPDEDDFMS